MAQLAERCCKKRRSRKIIVHSRLAFFSKSRFVFVIFGAILSILPRHHESASLKFFVFIIDLILKKYYFCCQLHHHHPKSVPSKVIGIRDLAIESWSQSWWGLSFDGIPEWPVLLDCCRNRVVIVPFFVYRELSPSNSAVFLGCWLIGQRAWNFGAEGTFCGW